MLVKKQDLIKVLENVNVDIDIQDANEDVSIIELIEDSLHLVSVLVELEVAFNIEFTDEELNGDILISIERLLEVINEKIIDKHNFEE